jgi:hypothetical protein
MSIEISSYDAFWGCAGGLRVASTFRLPHLLHRSRFTKPTIGGPEVIARRCNAASVNTPTCRQLRHSTVSAGSARNARSEYL